MLFTIIRHGYTYMYLIITFSSCVRMLKLFNFSILAFYTGIDFLGTKFTWINLLAIFFPFRNNNITWQFMVDARKIRQYVLQTV